jgi:predicted N-acetyltransferase YhbS
MQSLVQEAWGLVGPKNRFHVGDVAWQHASGSGDDVRALFEDGDGRVAAWGWLHGGTHLEWQVDPRQPELLAPVLDWAEGATAARTLASDEAGAEILRSRGWTTDDDAFWFAHLQRELDDLPGPEVPTGFVLRSVSGLDEVGPRAAVHRAAWVPSQMTQEKMHRTMSTWPYRADLDCVAVAPDGTFAASTLAWLDERNRVAELEPVGTAVSYRRRGLGRATNLFALHRLRGAGAETAIVYSRGDAAYPIPKLLYESIGFRQHDRTLTWVSRRA